MQLRLSSPYHPQTDGQTERLNVVMEKYLRCYVNYLEDNWPKWLPLAEFAANSQMSESTNVSPFFANTGWDPRITTNLHLPESVDRDDARAHELASTMAEIHEFARTSMIDAQQRHQDQADKQRTTAPQFRHPSKNTRSARPSRKLDHKRECPFKIIEDLKLQTLYAYRVDFPTDIKVHPVRDNLRTGNSSG